MDHRAALPHEHQHRNCLLFLLQRPARERCPMAAYGMCGPPPSQRSLQPRSARAPKGAVNPYCFLQKIHTSKSLPGKDSGSLCQGQNKQGAALRRSNIIRDPPCVLSGVSGAALLRSPTCTQGWASTAVGGGPSWASRRSAVTRG